MTRASNNLMRDGAYRAGRFFQRLINGELPVEIGDPVSETDRLLRTRAMHLAGVVAAVPVLMVATTERAVLGMNLFTAEAVFMGAAGLQLLNTLRRLI